SYGRSRCWGRSARRTGGARGKSARPRTDAGRHRCTPRSLQSAVELRCREKRRCRFNVSVQQCLQSSRWRVVVKGLPGSGVEFSSYLIQVALIEALQAGALGEVLAQEAVGVLVATPLPGA